MISQPFEACALVTECLCCQDHGRRVWLSDHREDEASDQSITGRPTHLILLNDHTADAIPPSNATARVFHRPSNRTRRTKLIRASPEHPRLQTRSPVTLTKTVLPFRRFLMVVRLRAGGSTDVNSALEVFFISFRVHGDPKYAQIMLTTYQKARRPRNRHRRSVQDRGFLWDSSRGAAPCDTGIQLSISSRLCRVLYTEIYTETTDVR